MRTQKNVQPITHERPKSLSDRNKLNSAFHESDNSLKSPNSTSSSTKKKTCTFIRDKSGYGFKITGNAPVKVKEVRQNGNAWSSGLRENDILLRINGRDVRQKEHKEVVEIIREKEKLELVVQTEDPLPNSKALHIQPKNMQPLLPPAPKRVNKDNERKPANSINSNNIKQMPKTNLSVNKNHVNDKRFSQNSLSDTSGRSTESDAKTSDSETDVSMSTSSSENNLTSPKSDQKKSDNTKSIIIQNNPIQSNKFQPENNISSKNNNEKIKIQPPITNKSQQEHNIVVNKIDLGKVDKPKPMIVQSNKLPSDIPKPKPLEVVPLSPKAIKSQFLKQESPPGKEYPVKSHSYNASVNQSSKILQNIKKGPERPRNRTIPLDPATIDHMSLNGPDKNEFRSNQKTYNTLPKKLPSSKSVNNDEKSKNNSNSNALILGREFEDDDNKESDDSNVSLSIIDLLSYPEDVLKRPGLVSILIIHANEQPNDLNVLMLYYACVMYKNIIQKQDFKGDSSVLANEIITTFILDKSPLFVSFEFDIVEEMIKNLRSSKNLNIIFDPLISNLFKRLQSIIESVKGKIQRGTLLQTDLPKLENEENKNAEMTLLQKTLVPIFNKSSKDSEVSDSVTAKLIGLATMYQYFYNPSTSYSISTRSRSTDGINNLGMQGKPLSIAEMYKINIFFSSHQQKISSSIRKKFKNISGHNITEATCKEPVICSVCEGLLWGPCPQGLYCSSCQSHCHMNCKKKLKNCPRKSRKTAPIMGTKEPQDKTSSSFLGRLSRKSSTSSIKNSNSQQNSDGPQNLGNISFNSASLHPDEKTNSNTNEENFGVFKAKSEDQLHRLISNAERFTSTHETSPLSLYNSIDNSSFGVNNNESSNVEVTDLIQDESLNDPDMKVDESFDAGSEIQTIFPNLDPETDKKRLIVLLEFYHKTRYILMNLKRFDYKLVKCWPSDYRTYAKALSLDCIDPFVQLIKSLVTTIRECITEQDFVDLEKAVYDWLSKDNDKQLKKWISLSSNLCCTNSLYLVKQLRQTTMRNIPELIKLMNVKMHKMVIVEELTQIRPLLISLPLIVKNIIKCLSKSDQQYLDQLAVWKDVSVKMDYLCEYIDRCCIPLVDWVNNGSISRRLDKTDLLVRTMEAESIESNIINFFIDFPRTMFHYQVLDFKMAKIFTWSRNTKRVSNEYQINYFIKGAEVLLIFYQEFILVLQKENDHFYLKPIKPNKNVTERIVPIIETTKFFATNGGQEEDYYLLNIIKKNSKDPTLIRVGFTRKEFADHYLEFFGNDFNLSRSISIYKLNDVKEIPVANFQIESNNNLPGIKLRSSESFSSQKSAIAPSSLIQPDIQNQENLPSEILATESEPVAEKELNNSVELSEGLSNASTTISDLKKDVCKYLNIEEEQYDTHLELIINETPKTLKDVFLMFYSVCSPIVDLTRHLILPDSEESVSVPSSQKKDIRKTLFYLSTLLRNIDCLNDIDEDQIDSNSPTEAKLSTDYPPLVADSENVEEPNKTISNEIVQEIISDIISESVDLTDSVPEPVVMRNSYKYIPDKCQIASTRSTTERSALYLTPSYIDPSIPNDETITTTRAQIVLSRNSNNMNM